MKRSLLDDDSEDDDYPVKHMTPTVEEEDDPLEAYMALNAQALLSPTSTTTKAHKQLLEGNDPMEGYIPPLPLLHGPGEDDSDEDVYRVAALLDDSDSGQQVQHPVAQAPVNHSAMDYYPIPPSSYKTHPDLAQLSPAQIKQLLSDKALSIESETSDTIIPITSFGHLRLDERLLSVIQQLGLSTPTPIQCSALPMALEGRDTIGLAETGSGKTLAYLIPLVVHVQRVLVHTRTRNSYGRSPVAIILVPTRELAHQVYSLTKKLCKPFGLVPTDIIGGVSKTNQVKSLKSGVDIVVGTPGRWMDLVRMGFACHSNLSFWVLDEADRMLDLGFESAIQSVSESIRPDRQTLLFSATFPKRIHALSKTLLSSRMVKITVGTLGQINQDISQHGVVLSSNQDKLSWLTLKWTELTRHGSLLVFSDTKDSVKTLTESLLTFGIPAIPLHGDMTQQERSASLQAFKKGDVPVLVCTDVAARGLDVKHVKSVVNYQVPKDWTTHTHRIGRTGRAGTLGSAYTLLLPTQSSFAALLVRHIEEANGLVDPEILRLALNDGVFKREREGLSSGSSTTTTRGGGFHRGRGRGHNSFCTTPRPGSSSGKPSRLDGFSFNLSSNGIKFQKASSSSSSNSHGTGTG